MGTNLNLQIVDAFQQGNQDAFREIFMQYYGSILHFTKKLTKNNEEGEEIAINTFMALFYKSSLFKNADNIKGFLFLTARNNCFDYLKKVESLPEAQKAFAEKMRDDKLFRYEYEFRDELIKKVKMFIRDLPEEDRKGFIMRSIERKKTAEIPHK